MNLVEKYLGLAITNFKSESLALLIQPMISGIYNEVRHISLITY